MAPIASRTRVRPRFGPNWGLTPELNAHQTGADRATCDGARAIRAAGARHATRSGCKIRLSWRHLARPAAAAYRRPPTAWGRPGSMSITGRRGPTEDVA